MDPATGLPPRVATDRYKKKLREEDHDRGDANYAKAGLAGALLAAALKSKRLTLGKRAAIGGAAGLALQGAVRSAGAGTKDVFGERSRAAKKTEKIVPYTGLIAAGVLGARRIRSAVYLPKRFSRSASVIEFAISPALKRKLIAGASLGSGIAIADAATSASFPAGETRQQAAIEGLKRGSVYGGVLAVSEPLIDARLVRALKRARIIKQLSRPMFFIVKKDGDRLHDEITGGIEGGIGVLATDKLIHHPGSLLSKVRSIGTDLKTPLAAGVPGKFLKGAAVGAVATGAIGALVSALHKKRQERRTDLSRPIFFIRNVRPTHEEDLHRQRRSLGLLAGGAVAAVGGLALLARHGRGENAVRELKQSLRKMPVGRGTPERLAQANAHAADRGYIHLKPMDSRQRKRFDKLPPGTQAEAGRMEKLTRNPNLSNDERKTARQRYGAFRSPKQNNFARGDILARSRFLHPIERAAASGHAAVLKSTLAGEIGVPGEAFTPELIQKLRKHLAHRANVDRYNKRDMPFKKMLFSAFVKDVAFKDLPAAVRKDISAFVKAKPDTMFSHYGMVTKELVHKADPHNLKTARSNVAKLTHKAARNEVHERKATKHILVNNDRIVDGHHFLAKAERGGVTGSLHVIDLTPSRFQLSRGTKAAPTLLMYPAGGELPTGAGGLPDFIAMRKRRDARHRLHVVEGAAAGGLVAAAGLHVARRFIKARKLSDSRPLIFFRQRQQLRDEDGDRFSNPLLAAAKGTRVYARTGPGPGDRVSYGGSDGALPVAHGQVIRAAYNKARGVRKWGGRGLNLAGDVGDVIAGRPRKVDYAGRPKQREWEKSYAKRTAQTALIGAAGLGLVVAARKNPALAEKAVFKPLRKARAWVNKRAPDIFASRRFISPLVELATRLGFNGFTGPIHYLDRTYTGAFFFDEAGRAEKKSSSLRRAVGVGAAAVGVSLLPGAVPILKIQGRRLLRAGGIKSANYHGKFVADYIDAAQGALNTGIPGRVAGRIISAAKTNPGGRVSRAMGGDFQVSHDARFRAGHLEALKHWDWEVAEHFKHKGKVGEMTPGSTLKGLTRLATGRAKTHAAIAHHIEQGGMNERDAIRHVATNVADPHVKNYFRTLSTQKAGAANHYARVAGLAPALVAGGAAGAVAVSRKKQNLARRVLKQEIYFDAWAEQNGWDVRDPRGRSARVFAPGSRKRERREKEWHETTAGRAKIHLALGAVAASAALGTGILIGRNLKGKKLPRFGMKSPVIVPKAA